jgi:phosphatidate phosphatase APP1
MSIRTNLRRAAIDLDDRWDELKLKLLRALGGPGPLRIFCYRGIGQPERLVVRGRVLVDRGPTTYESNDGFWDDLVNMYRRLHTTEIPGARVKVSAEGASAEAVTDREGYFELELEAAGQPFSAPIQRVEVELLEPAGDEPVVEQGEAAIRSPNASFLIISDIDDTVVQTHATNLLAMARATFLGNARSRTAFPGVASLYTALAGGPSGNDQNQLMFISRSPWNLYDLFDQFCDLQGIPQGRVLCLRDWGLSDEGLTRARTKGYKFGIIRRVLELEPDLGVILVGDSGQKDAEIYQAISDEFPGRILGAFIRNVTQSEHRAAVINELAAKVEADGAVLYLVDDSLDVARRAAEHGWIRREAVQAVAAEVEAARRLPDTLDELIEGVQDKKPE